MGGRRDAAGAGDASVPKRLAPLDHIKNLYDGAAANLAQSAMGNASRKICAKKDLVEAVREMNSKPGLKKLAAGQTQSDVQLRSSASQPDTSNSQVRATSAVVDKPRAESNEKQSTNKPRRNVRTAMPLSQKRTSERGGRFKSASEILQETLNFNAKKYNDLKIACEEKEKQLNKLIDELASLQVENESLRKMELHQTSDTLHLDELSNKIEEVQSLLENRQHRQAVLHHMKSRLDVNQVAFDAHIKGMEEALNASSREFEEVKLLMRQLESGNANAQDSLKAASERISKERDLRNKHLAQRRQEAANAKRMEEWREKREKARMMLDAELDGDLSEEGERQLIAAVNKSTQQDQELERIHRHATQAVSTYEEAFNAIREATGVRTLDEMVEKFLGQSANKQALVEERFEVEQRQRKVKEELARVQTEFAEFKAAGIGGSELNREMYDKLDNNILEARHELKIKQGVNERLEKILLQVRAGMLGLMGRLAPFKQVLSFDDEGPGLVTSSVGGHGGGSGGNRGGSDILELTIACENKLTRLLDCVNANLQSQTRGMLMANALSAVPASSLSAAEALSGSDSISSTSIIETQEGGTATTGVAQRGGETVANLTKQCNLALSLLDSGEEVTHINNVRVRPRRALGNGELGTPLSTARSMYEDGNSSDSDSSSQSRLEDEDSSRRNIALHKKSKSRKTQMTARTTTMQRLSDGKADAVGAADDEEVKEELESLEDDENVVCDAAAMKARSRSRIQKALEQQRAHVKRQRTLSTLKSKRAGQDQESLDRLAQPSKHHRRANRKTIYERPDLA